jgi:uncharacterized protein
MSALTISPAFLLTGFAGGIAIGLTGMGGGAVLTPVLLSLGVPAQAAVGSDLLASLFIKPVAGWVHSTAKTVRWDIVRWLTLGSVPAALAGSLLSSRLTGAGEGVLKQFIGATLLIAAAAMVARAVMARRAAAIAVPTQSVPNLRTAATDPGATFSGTTNQDAQHAAKPLQSVLLGIVGGFLVGLTSVGSGSLMVVFLTLIYPRLAPKALVGTDIVQAIPLVAAAAFGHLLTGNVRFGLTAALLIGGIPGAYIGAMLSSGRAIRIVRPMLITLLMATGIKLVAG